MALIITIASFICLLCGWSFYKIFWKYDTKSRMFAVKHFTLFVIYGLIVFIIMMVFAMGSMAHGTSEYHEIYVDNILLGVCMLTLVLSFVGGIGAIIKGLLQLKK